MKKINLKDNNINNLKDLLKTLYKKKFTLLLEKSNKTKMFKNSAILKNTKKDIARILTVMHKRDK